MNVMIVNFLIVIITKLRRKAKMIKDILVGVKMSKAMYNFLDDAAEDEDITIPAVIRKILKEVMLVYE